MSSVDTLSASDVCRSNFDFEIDKFPLSGPDGMQTPCYGLFRSDTGEFVGDANNSKSKDYVPHQTDDVVALIEACEEAFDDCNASCYFRGGHYVSLAPSNEYRRQVYGGSDNVWPRLVIRGSFERRAFSATLGYYRDACKNLHIPQSVSYVRETIRHNNNLRRNMDELIAQFQTLKESWQTFGNLIESMQAQTVALPAFLDAVYGVPDADATERAVTIHRNRTEAIFRRMARERTLTGRDARGFHDAENPDFTVSVWEAFNAVQGYVQHEATRKNGANDWDRIILASRDAKVRKAEAHALTLVA